MKIIVGGIIEKDNKILMVKEAKKKCYGKWNVPAGHLEDGETIFEGAIREIFEETGCKVRLKNMLPIMSGELENTTFMIIITKDLYLREQILHLMSRVNRQQYCHLNSLNLQRL